MTDVGRRDASARARKRATRIGVISDTHGLLRPEALAALSGVARILHAGDIGRLDILERLRLLAPVTAIRGNVDGDWAVGLPGTELVEIEGVPIYLIHDVGQLDVHATAAGIRVVVSGHTHRPSVREKNGVLYLNPGSAGPRRFDLPVTLALLEFESGKPRVRLVNLVD